MSDRTWIEEQKENRLFRGVGGGGDAQKMIEKTPTNRYVSKRMGQQIVAAKFLGKLLNVSCYDELCDLVEAAQLCVDGRSREDFMKVAIEQWQGKIASMKGKLAGLLEKVA